LIIGNHRLAYCQEEEKSGLDFIQTSKTWSSGPGQSKLAMPKTYDVEYWKIGIMGSKGLNLFFDKAGKTEIKIRINSIFKPQYSIILPFQYSNIPLDVSR
jgi:hypothetical protein